MKKRSRADLPTKKASEYLRRLYYTPTRPSSMQGISKLMNTIEKEKKFKPTRTQVENWLDQQQSYTVHRQPVRRFRRSKVIVSGLYDQYDADLMSMESTASENDGYKYVLVVLDVFSRYAWMLGMRTKSNEECIKAFQTIFKNAPFPKRMRTDRGTEFTGTPVRKFFEKNNVHLFFTNNETKANYAERLIKTVKKKIFRYFSAEKTRRWIDVLQEMVSSYNRTYHDSIRMAPKEVNKKNEKSLWWELYLSYNIPSRKGLPRFKFRVGDVVRTSVLKSKFEREYGERWTTELFRIRRRFYRQAQPLYEIEDYAGEALAGSFYEPELRRVRLEKADFFRIKDILKSRGSGSRKEYLVSWLGYPRKFNSWIPSTEMPEM